MNIARGDAIVFIRVNCALDVFIFGHVVSLMVTVKDIL